MACRRVKRDDREQWDHAELREGRGGSRINHGDHKCAEPKHLLCPVVEAEDQADIGQRQNCSGDCEPEQHLCHGVFRQLLAEDPHRGNGDDGRCLAKITVECLVKLQHVERPLKIAVSSGWRGAESEDDDACK